MGKDAEKDAVIVIFGCRHQKEFLARADTAMHFAMQNNINPIFVFVGNDSPPPKRVIKVFGENRIIWEDRSRDTQENIRNTFAEIRRNWLTGLPAYFVSSWYHFPRIKLLLRRAGINVKRETFVKSYSDIAPINVLVEPFAFFAAYFQFNRRLFITAIKRKLGYNV